MNLTARMQQQYFSVINTSWGSLLLLFFPACQYLSSSFYKTEIDQIRVTFHFMVQEWK